jgi:hypothetical protein
MSATLAQVVQGGLRAWSIADLAITFVVVMAVIALVYVGCRAMGLVIPDWVVQVIGIVVVACVIILAIRFVMGL